MKVRARVWPASIPVRQALDAFLSEYEFERDESKTRTYWIDLFGWKVRLPNPKSRRVMVPLHDLHHIATGYSADLASEAEIGAWELRAGCTTATLWILNLSAAGIGMMIAPRRTVRAFAAGRGTTTLYRLRLRAEDVVGLTVGELRRRLGIPERGLVVSGSDEA